MRKALLFLTFAFVATLSSAQSFDIAGYKLAEFADENHNLEELVSVLTEFKQNPNLYFSSISFNATIVDKVVANGVFQDDIMNQHVRIYFSTSDAARRAESEAYLLENL